MKRFFFLFQIFFLHFCHSSLLCSAQRKDTLSFLDKITRKRDFLLAPQLDRSPETGFLTGIYYLQMFKFNRRDTTVRTSNVENTFSYTERHQFIAEVNNTFLTHKEKYILRGVTLYKRFNEYFYGIGNEADLNNKELIDFQCLQFIQRFTRNINNRYFVGLQYQYYQVFNTHYLPGGLLATSGAEGIDGSLTSGAGPVFLVDTRDNVINSSKGFYLDVSALAQDKILGSRYDFKNLIVDMRKFFRIYRGNVLGLQFISNLNRGDIPFRQLAMIGGDIMMRGYYQGSFRDKNLLCAQAELRVPVWRFIGMVLFTSAGEVQPALRDFSYAGIKYGYGFGLRLMFIRHERVNVGGDAGFGKGTRALYFGSGESF